MKQYLVIMASRPMLATELMSLPAEQDVFSLVREEREREKAVGGFLFLNLFQVFLSSKSGYPRP